MDVAILKLHGGAHFVEWSLLAPAARAGADPGCGDLLPVRGQYRRLEKFVETLGITRLSKSLCR